MTAERDRRTPGRPRSARADEAIIDAVLELLAEGTTIEALSMDAVAARARVGKATIYRRWSSKDTLVVDAVAALKGPLPEIAGERVRDDLVTLLRGVRARQTAAGRILPCLVPELHRRPDLHERYQASVAPRRQAMRDVLRRGVETGELRPDVDIELAVLLLASPMIVQSLLNWDPDLDQEGLPERIVDVVLAGIGG